VGVAKGCGCGLTQHLPTIGIRCVCLHCAVISRIGVVGVVLVRESACVGACDLISWCSTRATRGSKRARKATRAPPTRIPWP
jgi:hypothetical protein